MTKRESYEKFEPAPVSARRDKDDIIESLNSFQNTQNLHKDQGFQNTDQDINQENDFGGPQQERMELNLANSKPPLMKSMIIDHRRNTYKKLEYLPSQESKISTSQYKTGQQTQSFFSGTNMLA